MISLTDEQLNNIFDQQWYINTSNAIALAMDSFTRQNILFDQQVLAQDIIDYNVDKQLKEKVFDHLIETLPKELNWENKSITEAFVEFKDIIDSCDLCPKFKKYSVKVKIANSGIMKNEFLLWKELVNTEYPRLNLTTIPYKTDKNKYKLTIHLVKD